MLDTQAIMRKLRDEPLSFNWKMHGIGFIKAYVDEERTTRLNIYNKLFLTPQITIHHDHPWHLASRILSGELTNTRYVRDSKSPDKFYEGTINCATAPDLFCGVEGESRVVGLLKEREERLPAGSAYVQAAHEIHSTEAEDGTVTLMERIPLYGGDGTARVFWPIGSEYVNADIHDLSVDETRIAINAAFEKLRLEYVL